MSRPFASGKHAFGFCDICGFRYPLHELKTEVVNLEKTGIRACSECWSPDNPQTQLGRHSFDDPQALRNPRPVGAISGRDLPAAYREDFSTGTVQTSPARIDGWWASNGVLTWNSSAETLNLISESDPSSFPSAGDPYIHRGWNHQSANDWLSIDTSVYKYVVSSFKVNRFPNFESDDRYFQDFQGSLFWTTDTSVGPSSWPYLDQKQETANHKPNFTNTQASDGFATENRDMASWFKVVFDMSDNADWSGTVTGIRLDYFDARDGPGGVPDYDAGDIDIDYIEVVAFHNPDL